MGQCYTGTIINIQLEENFRLWFSKWMASIVIEPEWYFELHAQISQFSGSCSQLCASYTAKCHRPITAKRKSKRSKQPQPLFNNTVRAQWV